MTFNTQKRTRRHNTSGFTGVQRSRDGKKWIAKIVQAGEDIHLGTFDTPEQASDSYQKRLIFEQVQAANAGKKQYAESC